MLFIGLTGGIATGKTTVSRQLSGLHGLPLIDSDALAHAGSGPGSPLLPRLWRLFPAEFFREDGSLIRERAGPVVFATPSVRRELEGILHPWIALQIYRRLLRAWVCFEPLLVLDAPLLLEKNWDRYCDEVVVVHVDDATQLERLRLRQPDMTDEEMRARIAAQMPSHLKLARATKVIDNSGTLAETQTRIDALVQRWRTRRHVKAFLRTLLGWPVAVLLWGGVEVFSWWRYGGRVPAFRPANKDV